MTTLSIWFHLTTFSTHGWNHTVVTDLSYKVCGFKVPMHFSQFSKTDTVRVLHSVHNSIQVAHVGSQSSWVLEKVNPQSKTFCVQSLQSGSTLLRPILH